jgi:UDP:flavonoid glycosyltransferase YjiC (YdhE family)
MTGYWRPDEVGDWQPSPDLEEFMARGPAPISIGFGSMPSKDSEYLSRAVHDAVERLSVRAVIEPGMASLSAVDDPMTIHPANLPHTWLLPRVRAIVHHGGAGTTAAALDTGVPQVIVPHLYDQHFWAERMHQLGVAPRPLPIDSLNGDRLASSIAQVLSEKRFEKRAKEISVAIGREGGTRKAISLIERAVESVGALRKTTEVSGP